MANKLPKVFLGCDKAYDDADIILFGAPFDSTTSFRPGARFASSAVRNDSFGMETYSPYIDKDIGEISVCDDGDLELPIGDTDMTLDEIKGYALGIYRDGKIPFMIGGEHLVTLGSVLAASEVYEDLRVIQFDAHADLRDNYLGVGLTHAGVMRRCFDILGEGKIYQFGIRSGEKEEFEFAKNSTILTKFDFTGLDEVVEALKDKPVYFTLDLDILDPSCFPGTGTPEAGGVRFNDLLKAIYKISKLNIVGLDVTELCPVYDMSGCSTQTACKIIRELLLSLGGKDDE